MTEKRIDVSELKVEGGDTIRELAKFLEEKMQAEVGTAENKIIIKGEEEEISKKYLRVLLRKFLHKAGLKDYFRVISGKEDTIIVKEKKTTEE